jgi:hypothetical protein
MIYYHLLSFKYYHEFLFFLYYNKFLLFYFLSLNSLSMCFVINFNHPYFNKIKFNLRQFIYSLVHKIPQNLINIFIRCVLLKLSYVNHLIRFNIYLKIVDFFKNILKFNFLKLMVETMKVLNRTYAIIILFLVIVLMIKD